MGSEMNKTLRLVLIAAGVSFAVSAGVVWASNNVDVVEDVLGS